MDNLKNKIGVIFLCLALLTFIIGGYILMRTMTNDKTNKETNKSNTKTDIRIDTKKDFIYFSDATEIIDDIYKRDVIINIKGYEEINNTLHNELESLSKNEVKVTNETIPEGTICENDLYSFSYRDYELIEYGDYKSILIEDYNYNCITNQVPSSLKSYVIDTKTGKSLSSEELITKFNLTQDKIIEQVKKRLEDTQILDESVQVIDIDGTINDLTNNEYNTNKALNISKNGKLMINFIVKSNKINYNDSIELN